MSSTLVRSSYPDTESKLRMFEQYADQLATVNSFPKTPGECAPFDTKKFSEVADAMRQLPILSPQIVSSALRQEIVELHRRYDKALAVCVNKKIISAASAQGLSQSVIAKPQEAVANTNNASFMFGNNNQAAERAKQSQQSTGLFTTFKGFFNFGSGNNNQQVATNANQSANKRSRLEEEQSQQSASKRSMFASAGR